MTTTTCTKLADRTWTGSYDMTRTARLVRRGEQTYLVMDQWCGSDVEGECYREFLYEVPDDRVSGLKRLLESDPNDYDSTGRSDWDYFLTLSEWSEFRELGRKSRFTWANDL